MEEIMRRKDAGEFGNFASSKLDNVNDEQIAAAVDDIFPTGDLNTMQKWHQKL